MRKFLKLSYNGEDYHGWQRQPNATSVQQTLEEALCTLLRTPVAVVGAGRTDTGVHARVMYGHFDLETDAVLNTPEDKRRFLNGMNRLCGPHIAIHDVIDVPENAHARFDAVSRTYKYFVTLEKSSFLTSLSWHSPSQLDQDAMNRAAHLLTVIEDFTSFAKLHSDSKTNICHVTQACWKDWKNSFGVPGIVFTISADRFLRNMVRAIVGTLVEVGRGKLTPEGFLEIVHKRDRCAAGTSMPPHALFLWDIKYPYI